MSICVKIVLNAANQRYTLVGVGPSNVNAGKEVAMETAVPRGLIGEPGTPSDSTGTIDAVIPSSRTNFISAMRILMAISAITTIVFAILFWPLAFLPAITTGILFSIMVGVDMLVWRRLPESDLEQEGGAAMSDDELAAQVEAEKQHWMEEERQREKDEAVCTAEDKGLLLYIVPAAIVFGVIAFVLAGIFLGWGSAALGGLFLFCYMLLIGAPIWLASIEENEEVVHERQTGEKARSIH